MKIIRDFTENKTLDFTAISLGMFDGVHRGHQTVINCLKEKAQERGYKVGIFSFWPHPRKVINPSLDIKLLTTLEEKKNFFENLGVEYLFLQEFDEKFRNLEAEDFVQDVLVKKLKTKYILIGYNHRFGKDQKGDFMLLKKMGEKLGFEVEQHKAEGIEGVNISSTKIRKALNDGNILEANNMLGYAYTISGKVIHGKKIGRTIGYPTANIDIDESKILPKKGAYVVEVWLDNQFYKGMLSIGTNPTVGGDKMSVEVYILDFSGDIYGKNLIIKFRDFLHEEIKFESLEKLIEKLDEDKEITRLFFLDK